MTLPSRPRHRVHLTRRKRPTWKKAAAQRFYCLLNTPPLSISLQRKIDQTSYLYVPMTHHTQYPCPLHRPRLHHRPMQAPHHLMRTLHRLPIQLKMVRNEAYLIGLHHHHPRKQSVLVNKQILQFEMHLSSRRISENLQGCSSFFRRGLQRIRRLTGIGKKNNEQLRTHWTTTMQQTSLRRKRFMSES